MTASPWIIGRPPQAGRLRLYCFPYAGGNAVQYLPWQAGIGAPVDIRALQLPGRGTRLAEAPVQHWPALLRALSEEIRADAPERYAFFGHSLGALMAFETARYAIAQGLPAPQRLFVSGCAAPRQRGPKTGLHLLPDEPLVEQLKDYNGTPREVLAHADLVQLLLPVIRADFALSDSYAYVPGAEFAVPITVLAGRRDEFVGQRALGWEAETSAGFEALWFDGGHFFVNECRQEVLEALGRRLGSMALGEAGTEASSVA